MFSGKAGAQLWNQIVKRMNSLRYLKPFVEVEGRDILDSNVAGASSAATVVLLGARVQN